MDELQRLGQQVSEEVGFLVGRGQFLVDPTGCVHPELGLLL
jgi:hypothetical protein